MAAPPTDLACGPSTTTSVTFEWGAVDTAVSYDVEWQALPAGPINDSSTTSTSLTLTGLTPGTSYQWRVRAQLP